MRRFALDSQRTVLQWASARATTGLPLLWVTIIAFALLLRLPAEQRVEGLRRNE